MVSLSTIQNGVNICDTPWLDVTKDPTTSLRYCILANIHPVPTASVYATNPVSLKFTVIVNEDCTWHCFADSSIVDIGKLECL